MGASAGRVLLIPKGDWNAETTYTGLDWVRHNGAAWVCKNTCTGIEPTETNADNWQIMSRDGSQITVDAAMSDQSENPVQNKVVKKYVDDKQVNIDGITLTLDETRNVIKLADALKDKIGSALQPESIVNNQITTEEGFALDARQANPNIDGTLAKRISDLNGSLNRYPSKLSKSYPTYNKSHTFPIEVLSLFFITYGTDNQADVYLCRCTSETAHALVPLHTSSAMAQRYEIKLDVATRMVTITSKTAWIQVDVINL